MRIVIMRCAWWTRGFTLIAACVASLALASDEERALSNIAACYADGIDAIGAGHADSGLAIWKGCFSEDLHFEMHFGPAYSVTCPGDKCPFPASMIGLARRVALAKGTFERAGYVATNHHLTSVSVELLQPDLAQVKGHLQAWHFRKDGTAVVGLGTWQVEVRKTAGGWRVTDEKLDSPLRVVVPKAE